MLLPSPVLPCFPENIKDVSLYVFPFSTGDNNVALSPLDLLMLIN